MEQPLFRKPETPDFAKPEVQRAFLEQSHDKREVWQKELNVNQAEQLLLQKRIQMMEEFINDLSTSDPQYSMLTIQVQMDQVELDELKLREMGIIQKLSAK